MLRIYEFRLIVPFHVLRHLLFPSLPNFGCCSIFMPFALLVINEIYDDLKTKNKNINFLLFSSLTNNTKIKINHHKIEMVKTHWHVNFLLFFHFQFSVLNICNSTTLNQKSKSEFSQFSIFSFHHQSNPNSNLNLNSFSWSSFEL